MEKSEAFKPGGSAFMVMASSPASSALKMSGPQSGMVNYLIGNMSSSVDAWLCFGQTSTFANAGAVIPAPESPRAVLYIKAGTAPRVFTFQAQPFVSGVTNGTGPAPVVIIPGDGI